MKFLYRIARIVALAALVAAPFDFAVAGAHLVHPCCAEATDAPASPAAAAAACDHERDPSCGTVHCGGCVSPVHCFSPLLPGIVCGPANSSAPSIPLASQTRDRPPGPPPRIA